jgi:hypothetical protein
MLRRLSAGILAPLVLLLVTCPVFADTGTYRISDYAVTLEPQNDGQVRLTVVQQWQVLSGDIPWITVGLPNKNFSIESSGGSASRVAAENSGGFTGVRIDLDQDYLPGQSFKITFTVLQRNLLERLTSEKQWRIDYTPGWYDRAVTDHLKITLVSPVAYETYSNINPTPTAVNGNTFVWERSNLAPGGKYKISVSSLDGNFLTASAPSGSTSGGLGKSFYITIAVIVGIGLLVFWGIIQNRRNRDARARERVAYVEKEMATDKQKRADYEKGFEEYVAKKGLKPDAAGRYYDRGYGDYITPAIWAAVLTRQMGSTVNPPPDKRSGSGTSGYSCACACVSCACACACACAGGGAAGCSRKTLHECRECIALKKEQGSEKAEAANRE